MEQRTFDTQDSALPGLAHGKPPATGDVLAGRYQLGPLLGEGAAGRVFRAFDRVTRMPVAVKVLAPVAGGPWSDRLGRELAAARRVSNPNVCRVHDLSEADGHHFLVMELGEGGTLRDTLRAAEPRAWDDRVRDVHQLFTGLAAIHGAGLVHRDVKPENVLRMRDGRLVLSDFGLAVPQERKTDITVGVGTPSYMAPELLLGAPATARSDVWSAAIVMHEVLFDCRPASRPATAPSLDRSRSVRRARQALRDLCAVCLADATERRPRDAVEVLRILDRIRAGKHLPLRRRARGAVALGAALAIAAAATGVWALRRPSAGGWDVVAARGSPAQLAGAPIATLPGRVHCVAALAEGEIGVVWGEPRRAERVAVAGGQRRAWDIPPESFATPPSIFPEPFVNNCPRVAPDGRRLLYTSASKDGRTGVLLDDQDGSAPRFLASGDMPVWHPAGELIALRVDATHAGIVNASTKGLTVLPAPPVDEPSMLLDLTFDGPGRAVIGRWATASAAYLLVPYSIDTLEIAGRIRLPAERDRLVRTRLGAGSERTGQTLLHMSRPDGSMGLARLGWQPSVLEWVAAAPPFDVTQSLALGAGRTVLVARTWRSDLELLARGEVTRVVETQLRVFHPDVNARGDVLVQADDGKRSSVVLFPADGGRPRVIGAGPLDTGPSFTADGQEALFTRSTAGGQGDELVRCPLVGACRTVARLPSADFPALSPRGDLLAYVGAQPYRHVAVVSPQTGSTRVLTAAEPCRPRWSGTNLWVARLRDEALEWVELDAANGARTGRAVPGRLPCLAAEPGPDGVLAERARVAHRESSRLMLAPAGL